MRITFLGTGTSHGVPVIACGCEVCLSTNPRNKRLRPSILVQSGKTTVVVDGTPDFRQQMLRVGLKDLDAVLLTHTHADHFMGLDDLRAFTQRSFGQMPIYGSPTAIDDVRRVYPYACTDLPTWPSVPSFDTRVIEPETEFVIGDLKVRAFALPHGRVLVYGYLFNDGLAYLTDCSDVPAPTVEKLKGVPVVVLDALRNEPHFAHMTIKQASEMAGQIGAPLTLLTHLCHEVEHEATEARLPKNIRIAYDGLVLEIDGQRIDRLA